MGKRLVIRGADFSANHVDIEKSYTWYQLANKASYNSINGSAIGSVNVYGNVLSSMALNKPINVVRVYLAGGQYDGEFAGITASLVNVSIGGVVNANPVKLAEHTIDASDVARGYYELLMETPVSVSDANNTIAVFTTTKGHNKLVPITGSSNVVNNGVMGRGEGGTIAITNTNDFNIDYGYFG